MEQWCGRIRRCSVSQARLMVWPWRLCSLARRRANIPAGQVGQGVTVCFGNSDFWEYTCFTSLPSSHTWDGKCNRIDRCKFAWWKYRRFTMPTITVTPPFCTYRFQQFHLVYQLRRRSVLKLDCSGCSRFWHGRQRGRVGPECRVYAGPLHGSEVAVVFDQDGHWCGCVLRASRVLKPTTS